MAMTTATPTNQTALMTAEVSMAMTTATHTNPTVLMTAEVSMAMTTATATSLQSMDTMTEAAWSRVSHRLVY